MGRLCEQLGVGLGSVIGLLRRLAGLFAPVLPPLVAEYRAAPVRHAYETGWRTDGHAGYAWLFCTPTLSLFLFRATRAATVPHEVLGDQPLAGTLVVDRYGGYTRAPCALQYCYAHLLRDVEALEQEFPAVPEVAAFTGTLGRLLAAARHLQGQPLPDPAYSAAAAELKDKLEAVVEQPAAIENARLFEEARQLAIIDPLTGLANHRQFYDQLAREFRRAQRYQRPLTLLMLDMDHFKVFNDKYGHLAGDQALRETADVLRQNARSVDILARYGGEEFAIILPETDLLRAASHAERIRSAVASHVFMSQETGLEHQVTVSIGVAAVSSTAEEIEELVHDAVQALYRAKAAGRKTPRLIACTRTLSAPRTF